jgi:hypothetical protein
MKKLVLIAALMLASASAQASTYRSGNSTVVIPRGCYSWSCISVSVPGHYSHNVRRSPQSRRHNDSTAVTSTVPAAATAAPATTVAPAAAVPVAPSVAAPAPVAAPSTGPSSNITVLPAPAQPAQR